MKGKLRRDVDVGDAVAIGQAEYLVVFDIAERALHAPTSLRSIAGLDQRDPPRFGGLAMHFHAVFRDMERDVGHVQEVIREIFLDQIAAVAKADDEVVEAEMAVNLHDVPDDRLAADFDHGLGPHRGFLRNPGSETTGQNDDLHAIAATVKAPSGANQRMAKPNTSTAWVEDV